MPRAFPSRRVPRHHLMIHRPPSPGRRSSTRHDAEPGEKSRARSNSEPARLSDLVLALLGVVMLGGLALTAAFVLASGATAP